MYSLFNPVSNVSRQHDTIAFTNGGGHLGYIWHIWAYGKIPDVDPRTLWEFYQPPLYYLICGYWVKFYTFLRIPALEAAENIQFFSLFCVTGTGIVLDDILRVCFAEKDKGNNSTRRRFFGLALVSVCPLFTYLGGSVNNDAILLFSSTLSIFLLLKWFYKPTIVNIVILALSVGLTVMSKNSGALIASGILVIFIAKLIREKNVKLFMQYLVFGMVSLPLGLWWNVRNVIRFQMPFLYFNPADKNSIQYIPQFTITERLFDLKDQINHLHIEIFNNSVNVDHNIFITTLKSIVFTCSAEVNLSIITKILGGILFVLLMLGSVFVVLFGFKGLFNKKYRIEIRISFVAIIVSYLVFYFQFILKEPFVHTMHARYIMPAMVFMIIMAVIGRDSIKVDKKEESLAKCRRGINIAAIILLGLVNASYFALTTLMTYE